MLLNIKIPDFILHTFSSHTKVFKNKIMPIKIKMLDFVICMLLLRIDYVQRTLVDHIISTYISSLVSEA